MYKRILSLLLVAVLLFTTLAFELPVSVGAAPGHNTGAGNYVFSNWGTSGIITTDIAVIASAPYHLSSYGYDTASSHGTLKVTTSGNDPYLCFFANNGNNGIYLGNYTHCVVTFRCETSSYLQLYLRNAAGGIGHTDWKTFTGSGYWQRMVFDIRSLHQLAGTTWSRDSNLYSFRLDFGQTSGVTFYIDSIYFTTNENDAFKYPHDRIGGQTTGVYGYNVFYSTNISTSLVGLPGDTGALTPGYNTLTFAQNIGYSFSDKGYSSMYEFDHWEIRREIASGNDLKTYGTETTTSKSGTYTLIADDSLYRDETVNLYIKAVFRKKTATITWKNYDGTTLKTEVVEYGNTPSAPSTPTRPSTAQYSYSFSGWNTSADGSGSGVSAVNGNMTYYAVYTPTTQKYNITWKNDDGSTIAVEQWSYGTTPSRTAPTKTSTAEYNYTFTGWSPAPTVVTQDATYKATFAATKRQYTVTFKNDDGTVLQSQTLDFGATPTYNGTPTKAGDAQYTYTFNGWDKQITTVSGDVEYIATYTRATNKYTVTWVDGNGNTLKTESLEYGATPVYTGDTPTKASTAQYSYTFDGWDKTITPVSGDVVYTAQFTSTVNKYTVFFLDEDGRTVLSQSVLEYGATPVYTGDTPTKPSNAQYTYTFDGWDSEIVPVTGDAIYTAKYSSTVNKYTIIFVADDGKTILQESVLEYGAVPTFAGPDPAKESTVDKVFTFNGWDSEIVSVTGAATYTATYTESARKYVITFVNWDDSELQQTEVAYGETPAYVGLDPTKPDTEQYSYTFSAWEPEIAPVTGDATYKALFSAESNLSDLIIKVEGTENIDENQAYIFNICSFNHTEGTKDLKVVVLGNSSVTVKNVPVGNCIVTEEDGWSWRYTYEFDPENNATNVKTITITANPDTTNNDTSDDNTAYYDVIRVEKNTGDTAKQALWLGGDYYKKKRYSNI